MIDISPQGIANRLKILVKETGATRQELGNLTGCTPQAAQGWLKTGAISNDKLMILADHYRYRISWLFTGEQPIHASEVAELSKEYGDTQEDEQFRKVYLGLDRQARRKLLATGNDLSELARLKQQIKRRRNYG